MFTVAIVILLVKTARKHSRAVQTCWEWNVKLLQTVVVQKVFWSVGRQASDVVTMTVLPLKHHQIALFTPVRTHARNTLQATEWTSAAERVYGVLTRQSCCSTCDCKLNV